MKRVHENDIEYGPDRRPGSLPDEEIPYHDGKPFTGIMFAEYEGHLREEAYENGEQHGPCRKLYPDGSLQEESNYDQGVVVGSSRSWYPSGQLEEVFERDENHASVCRKKWSEDGVLRYEWRFDVDLCREWYPAGELKYEKADGLTTYYNTRGDWAFRSGESVSEGFEWNQAAMESGYAAMIGEEDLENYMLRWIKEGLERDRPLALRAVRRMLEHNSYVVTRNALHLIRQEELAEVLPDVERLVDSTIPGGSDDPTDLEPIFALARRTLALLRLDDPELKAELTRIDQATDRFRMEKQSALRGNSRNWNRTPLSLWSRTSATFLESLRGVSTLTTADQLFGGEPKPVRVDELSVFEFKARGMTFRAILTTAEPLGYQRGHVQTVLFNPENPREYLFVREFGDCCVSRGGCWDPSPEEPITAAEWLAVVADDPTLRVQDDHFVEWSGEEGGWFDWADGCVFSRGVGTPAGLAKALELADRLRARVWRGGNLE